MLFSFYILDRPDTSEQRLALRPAQYEHLGKVEDRILTGGPLLADDGETMIGSLLVIDFPDQMAAENWLANAPFTTGGVFGEATVRPYKSNWPRV
ncbi:MAG: YciI family protein [Candidatus Competibacteraceae bacterium]|nr:YciI family protein [Candidatus Competibacteraceae bacterium]MCB1804837.1 YciI family protein [Candidatus Competibacteraceae bacterium]MCB1813793.1 YciI family protein [Candidatus Competibacteraceae bacterium]